jgi:hypothetical protein
MSREDRGLVEELFADGSIQVPVVQQLSLTVIIKGTQIYDLEKEMGRWVVIGYAGNARSHRPTTMRHFRRRSHHYELGTSYLTSNLGKASLSSTRGHPEDSPALNWVKSHIITPYDGISSASTTMSTLELFRVHYCHDSRKVGRYHPEADGYQLYQPGVVIDEIHGEGWNERGSMFDWLVCRRRCQM